jgi:glucose-1-phosphate thymidylyltransferase
MWGIIPAAGKGSRIQPLAFSKELLPLTSHASGNGRRPRAVSDYLMERLTFGGATRICFVISPEKSDILQYYGGSAWNASICYTVQPRPEGLCDAIFCALPVIEPGASVLIGLPDTIWFPANAMQSMPDDRFSFLLFPVAEPQHFDSVEWTPDGRVIAIHVKQPEAPSNWIWGAFKLPQQVLWELFELWKERGRKDQYIGTLVNAWMERGGKAWAVPAGTSYFDVGTMDGYLEAIQMMADSTKISLTGKQVA